MSTKSFRTTRCALVAAQLHAIGIPEEYGDHLAAVAVAEEIARVCGSTQQVAGANELFSLPLLLAGSEALKHRHPPRIASRR